MTLEVRPLLSDGLSLDEAFDLILAVDSSAFDDTAPPEALESVRALLELDRSFLAWDDKEPVGCASIYSMVHSVPGGSMPVAGVTWVGVKPTHRRRGAMSQMLTEAHRSTHEAGREPIAALWAAEPPIYGRFGYGLASQCLSVVVQRAHGSLSRAPHDRRLRLRLLDPESDRQSTQPVYDAVRAQRPGMPTITTEWHARLTRDLKDEREGAGPLRTVVVEDDEHVRGYARYAFKHNWADGYADGSVNVRQLVAADPGAEAALWRYLIDFDLSSRVDAWNLPSDSPLQWWLDQPRHHKRQLSDALYVRLIDIGQALTGRSYAAAVDVVLSVRDEHCPWNAGSWRLSADTTGSTCTPTTDSPDLTLDVATMGAVFLGGTTLDSMGAAGWVEEHSPGTLHQVSSAFRHRRDPWSPFVF